MPFASASVTGLRRGGGGAQVKHWSPNCTMVSFQAWPDRQSHFVPSLGNIL